MSRSYRFLALSLVLLGLLLLLPDARAQSGQPEVIILEATGAVSPPFESYIIRGLEEADKRNAEVLILMMDTPGGSVTDTFDIVQAIRTSDIPVIVFVGPPGAKAASAGLLITLAGHGSAMSPDTAIGASSPILPSGEDLETTSDLKAKEYLSAEARSLAEGRGDEAVQFANDAVYDAKAITAVEAFEIGLVDFMAEDIDDLLTQLDGFEVELAGKTQTLDLENPILTHIPMNLFELFFLQITHPNIVALLIVIGPLAIMTEIRSPGGWVLGVGGVIITGLALYGLGVLPVNWFGLIFIALGIVMFIIEFTTPTHGVLTASGVASMAVGIVILLNQPGVEPFGNFSIPLVIVQSLFFGGIFFTIMIFALRIQKRQPTTGIEGLIGQIGTVTQDLDPDGRVLLRGERWKARASEAGTILIDTEVEVIEVERMRLTVRLPQDKADG